MSDMNESCSRCGRTLLPLERLYRLAREAQREAEEVEAAERHEDLDRVRVASSRVTEHVEALALQLRCRAGLCD
jgi:hypothetical protein